MGKYFMYSYETEGTPFFSVILHTPLHQVYQLPAIPAFLRVVALFRHLQCLVLLPFAKSVHYRAFLRWTFRELITLTVL